MNAFINGIELAYADSGPRDAPTVILHHPLATDMSFWDGTVEVLSQTYRVIRFDARGHGASAVPDGPYDFATLTADVIGLMDHLAIAKAHFVGLSMGGMIAQSLGISYPERLLSLTIASAGPRTPDATRPMWLARADAARAEGMAPQVALSIPRWLTETTRRTRPDLAARCEAMVLATPAEGFAAWCAAIATLDMVAHLPGIVVPTLVVAGAEDQAVPLAASAMIASAIPGARLAVIPDAAHFSALEAPDAFHAALLPFLAEHAPPRA